MTFTVKQTHVGNYYVTLEQTTSWDIPIYNVVFTEKEGEQYYIINRTSYCINDRKNANATYNRYVKKAKDLTD